MDLVTMLLACSLASDNSIVQAMVETGSQNKPLMVSVVGGESKTFPTEATATNFVNQKLQQGHAVNIGLMQIPNRWLETYHLSIADTFKPCKNMVIATRIMTDLRDQCLSMKRTPPITNIQACVLSMYETGDPEQGKDYANKVMDYAKAHPFVPPPATLEQPKPKTETKVSPETKTGETKAEETKTNDTTSTTTPTPISSDSDNQANKQNVQH